MKTYTVSEAILYLKQLYPDVAPRNEETIRRAIRNGELPAERGYGRNGCKINESDLIEFSQRYSYKMKNVKDKIQPFSPIEVVIEQAPPVSSNYTFTEILKNSIGYTDPRQTKIELIEARKKWEERRAYFKSKINMLQNELTNVESEIQLIESELKNI